jgi:hypothetical protein
MHPTGAGLTQTAVWIQNRQPTTAAWVVGEGNRRLLNRLIENNGIAIEEKHKATLRDGNASIIGCRKAQVPYLR